MDRYQCQFSMNSEIKVKGQLSIYCKFCGPTLVAECS